MFSNYYNGFLSIKEFFVIILETLIKESKYA